MYKGEPYAEPMLMQRDTLDGSYTLTAHDGTAFTLTVEKDPEQQREGRTFIFQTDATDLPKTASYFNGKTCTVLEQVEPKLRYEPLAIVSFQRFRYPKREIVATISTIWPSSKCFFNSSKCSALASLGTSAAWKSR